ncbi:MAG TPA: C4-type zinc ribbon domain-containing protein [Tenuifilaceae bacterium]|nr:C4-type zinc ribbon domain-containing protein [Tenuifilaceae bacterium]HPE17305.1 C4-type zinc ribbon domain-containing protein [Tenuifilaceae bacterium]HPJ44531.1 C4-type zinc ribbon domain-containing protein [Tenuifilaceae bacterium]HPQ33069.1 C4-type zinc ribbon domain-containing protein [Tenuifilaceae bacterium]HRX67613.1 C4-type zinc ribbon domain-containing protein [Tenuifilaceae bacterium]
MAAEKTKTAQQTDLSVEEKLKYLYELQQIDSKIDQIKVLRGELPLEVQDLEDEVEGLETRISNLKKEIDELDEQVNNKKLEIKNAEGLISKYDEQQKNVRNNREYDSLSKEIEYQTLEMELCEKRIKEFTFQSKDKKQLAEQAENQLEERKVDLQNKKNELNSIVTETQKEEEDLTKKSEAFQEIIEPRLLTAYKRIRANARNGLAVVTVKRDACGGCFNKIPPQRQLDIKVHKKIIVCEYCGRILVDQSMSNEEEQ